MRIARLLLLFVVALPLLANSTETTPPVAVISPWTYWPTLPESGRFYRPTGVRVGSNFYLYVQGGAYKNVTTGPGSLCGAVGEEALAFVAPYTATGMRSAFTYAGAVSPCNTSVPDVHYQTGGAFVSSSDGKVKLTIDESQNGSHPLKGHFKQVLLGSSSDGKNFTWKTFLKQSKIGNVTYSVSQVVMVQATANSNWWGTFQLAWCTLCDGSEGTGFWSQGRIRVEINPLNPNDYVVSLMNSGGAWQAVNADGTFSFVPLITGYTGARSIVNNNNTWEAWTIAGGTPNGGCDDGDSTSASSLGYYTVSQGGSFGPYQTLTSLTRAMPSQNGYGRLDPYRVQDPNGKRLLYSVSNDRMCEAGRADGFRGFEILVTEVNN